MRNLDHSLSRDIEELISVIEELKERARSRPVIVEGAKDIESLEKLGVDGHLIPLNQGKSLIDLCTDLSLHYDEAIILTDWDAKGNRLCSLLKQALKACDMGFDTRLRGRLASLLKKEIKDVQGIYSFIVRNHTGVVEPDVEQESLYSTGEEKTREDCR